MCIFKKSLLSGLVLLTLSSFTPVYAEAVPEPSVIHVTGYAEQEVAPDTALITLGMENVHADAAEARRQNTAVMNKLTHALLEIGLGYNDLQTVGFNMQPRYDQSNKKIIGYRVINNLKVRVRDLKKLPEVLDKARESGTNTVRNMQFTCGNIAALKERLLKEAVTNGRRAAEAAAIASGSQLGKAKEINISGRAPVFRSVNVNAMKAMSSEADTAPQLQAGVQTVSETVDMTFYLE